MPEPLEIRVLGPFEVLAGGTAADVGGSKRQALLAMLALNHGRVVSVDALIDGLWGEELPSSPRNALHHHVARLRATLGEDAIVGSADGYALADAIVDAARFEELLGATRRAERDGNMRGAADTVAEALALWRGPALQGLTATAWFSAEAHRLETLRVDALEEQFEVELSLGEHRELAPALRAAIEENPYRERLWGQLMLALYRSGRQADALETFQEARRVLGDELGLEPGPELRRLQDAILAHDPAIAAVVVESARGNLPAPSTSFVGRDEEVAQVRGLLQEHRLVTLIGPPGVGKSRLAVETARALDDGCPEGVWLVDFGRAGGSEDAVRILASAVDVRGADPLASVTLRLRDAKALLVLDACEHVLDEAGRIATAFLAGCPQVRILATSREALHVASEVRMPVVPLGPPAVDLFLERARAARPGFELQGDDGELVEEVVRRLDGLPLAIELAAARMNVLGLAELLSIFDRRASLLREGAASDPARSALGALVEWSYDLLHGDEKTLLQQLAVHRGGASLASLAAVAESHDLNEATVTYLISALVDKSIVFASFATGGARYDMLDIVRDYVLAELAEAGALDTAREAHARYFARLAEEAGEKLRGPEWLIWLRKLEPENDNFWGALSHARDASEPAVAACLGTLGWYFILAERISEGRQFLELAISVAEGVEPPEAQIEQLALLCYLATEELDLEAALAIGEQALELGQGLTAPRAVGLTRLALSLALGYAGDQVRSDAMAAEAAASLEAAGDDWGAAAAGLIRGSGAAHAGDVETVEAMAAVARRHSESTRYDAFLVPALLMEAWVARRHENFAAATERLRRAHELAVPIGFGDHAAFALAELGAIALARGDVREAEELERQSLATADAAHAAWAAAYARVQLGRCAAAAGDAAAAAGLYRRVLEWSQTERPHQSRETLFLSLAGSPATAAELGLSELGETALT